MAATNVAIAAEGRTIPIMVQVTVETTGRMLVGSEIGAALTALEAMKPDVIGMNCATGPGEMTEHQRHLAQVRALATGPEAGALDLVASGAVLEEALEQVTERALPDAADALRRELHAPFALFDQPGLFEHPCQLRQLLQ